MMLRTFLTLCLLLSVASIGASSYAQSNAGIGTTTPDNSALLEVAGFTQGILTPRMTNAQRNAIASPTLGLLIYQTDATATEGITFYYWNGWKWVPWGWTANLWLTTGNSGTTAGTSFLGTGDSVDLTNSTNNTSRWRFYAGGDIALTSTTTAQGLQFTEPSGSGSNYTHVRAKAQLATIPWVLPDSQGLSRQILMNDGAGNLYWGNLGSTVTLASTTLSTVSANVDDMVIPDDKAYIRICASANYDLTGITGGVNGRYIVVVNVCNGNFRVVQESASSSATNRILTGGGGSYSLARDEASLFVYDGVSMRWRLTAKTP